MKKQLTVALGLAVLSTSAFATKARLEALGEDNYGSYYIQDNRNIFLNPARINDNKDMVTYEFGRSGTGTAAVTDSPATPKAEGGFTKAHGNLVYGLHFGNTTPTVGLLRGITGGDLAERQPWDLFIGGDTGIKWGANVTYENYDGGRAQIPGATPGTTVANPGRVASNSLRTRLGVILGDFDIFANISLMNKATSFNGNEAKGRVGGQIGASYLLNNYRLFADYTLAGVKYQGTTATANFDGTPNSKEDIDYNQIRIGAGRQERLNDKATLFAKLMAIRQSFEDDGNAIGSSAPGGNQFLGPGDLTNYQVPLVVGLEYAATSWLDLRGSVSQNIWSKIEADPKTGPKSSGNIANTAVRAGASLKFGEFAIDGLISTSTDDANVGTTNNSADGSTNNGNGNLRLDRLLARASMIYRF
jgi:hypothetical protein